MSALCHINAIHLVRIAQAQRLVPLSRMRSLAACTMTEQRCLEAAAIIGQLVVRLDQKKEELSDSQPDYNEV